MYLNRLKLLIIALFALTAVSLSSPIEMQAQKMTNFIPKAKGWENRLTLNNILSLTKTRSGNARAFLQKIGYKKNGNEFSWNWTEHYQQDWIYTINFKNDPNSIGFKNILIYTEPEMRMIQTAFLAGGYSECLAVRRDGARWTKIYFKKGYPTYSLSMLLTEDMEPNAQTYSFNQYNYCLICEQNTYATKK